MAFSAFLACLYSASVGSLTTLTTDGLEQLMQYVLLYLVIIVPLQCVQ